MAENVSGGRKRKSLRNLAVGVGAQLITALINFVLRTVVIKSLGLEYASLNGLFTEIIAMLTLAELGVGSAITYSLYKPLAERDEARLAQLMRLFKKAYRYIAIAVTLLGLALTPFIHLLVDDIGFERDYVRLVFVLFAIKTASSYMFSYKSTLITADQKMYKVTIVRQLTRLMTGVVGIILIHYFKSFIGYIVVQLAFTLAGNFALSIIADREYPFLKRGGELPAAEKSKIFSNIRSVFIEKVSAKITNSTDNILIALLVGSMSVGYYSNYALVIATLTGLLSSAESAISASVGHLFAFDNNERVEKVLNRLQFAFALVGVVCACCLMGCLTPFVTIWLGKQYAIGSETVFVISLNFFFQMARMPLWISMNAAGLFKYDKYTSIAGSVVNLIVSLILGSMIGMTGIFVGTTLTHGVQAALKLRLLYKRRLLMPLPDAYIRWEAWVLIAVLTLGASSCIGEAICAVPTIPKLILACLACGSLGAIASLACFAKSEALSYYIKLLSGRLPRAKAHN